MKRHSVEYGKALRVLEKLLKGLTPKEIVYELGVSRQTITNVRKMFPLFTGGMYKDE